MASRTRIARQHQVEGAVVTIEVYGFERADGTTFDFTTQNPGTAREFARRHDARVIAHTYECTDSEPVDGWDFTGQER